MARGLAGGDGTINEGLTLALLPAGTGNDLAATLARPEDPAEAVAVLRQNQVRILDAAWVRSEGLGTG